MGGYERMNAMVELINSLLSKEIRVIILTNNPAPVRTPNLIPDFLTIMGTDSTKIDIFSTHQYLTSQGTPPKYDVINTQLRLCGYIDINDNLIETIQQCKLEIFREWFPVLTGGRKIPKKNKKHRKSSKKHTSKRQTVKGQTKQPKKSKLTSKI
jgi:hypothetical protein